MGDGLHFVGICLLWVLYGSPRCRTMGRLQTVVFAGLIFCGIMIRKYIGGFIKGIHNIATDNINEADDIEMKASLDKARIFVLSIWVLLIVEAWIGIAKPGSLG